MVFGIKSFFMSIDREQTLSDLIKFIKLYVDKPLIDSTIQLPKIILTNNVTVGCKRACSKKMWRKLPEGKSLFGITTGYPIGDITSQFSANFILTYIDNLINYHNLDLVRYADDLRILGSKEDLLQIKDLLFKIFPTVLHLTLNKDKVILQPTKRGIPFVGYKYILPGKRLKYRSFINPQNHIGFLKHCRSYKFIQKIKKRLAQLRVSLFCLCQQIIY